MAIKLFLTWWYGPGWKNAFFRINQRIEILAGEFSMSILLKTLFEPWKQITSYRGPNAPFELIIRVWFDNVFARCVGFVIRSFVLVVGIISCAFMFVFGVVLAVLWPLVPLSPILLVILSVVQI